MNNHTKHIMQLIEDSLRDAINEIKNGHVDRSKIHFKRVVFSADHNLVVVEIGQEQCRDMPESFFENDTTRRALLLQSNCSNIDVMDLGESTFIYFWIPAKAHSEKARELNLVYAV